MDSSTSHPVIYSSYHKNFQQREPACPQYKEATFRSKATQPSSASHLGSFPRTTSRLPQHAIGENFRGTVPNLPQQGTPSFVVKPPSFSSTRHHTCNRY